MTAMQQISDSVQQLTSPEHRVPILGLSVKDDVLFSVLISLLIFAVGFTLNKWYDGHKERKRIHELGKYFETLISLLEAPLLELSEELARFSSRLAERKIQNVVIFEIASFNLEPLLRIDHNDAFRIFVGTRGRGEQRRRLFAQLYNNLYSIRSINDNHGALYDSYTKKLEGLIVDWDKTLPMIPKYFSELKSGLTKEQVSSDKLLKQFALIELELLGTPNHRDLFVMHEKFVKRVHVLAKEHKSDPRTARLQELLEDPAYAFESIVNANSFYSDHFKKSAMGLKFHYDQIVAILQQLRAI